MSKITHNNKGFRTRAIRSGIAKTNYNEHSPPIFLTSSYWFDDAHSMQEIFADKASGHAYSRYANPNTDELICKLAALECCENGVVTASGMSAIFLSVISFLQHGDHLIATRSLFGSTYKLFSDVLPRFGITTTLVDPVDTDSWHKARQANTRMMFVETPSNPALEIIDLTAARNLCNTYGMMLNVDNCFATPYLQQPVNYGADIIVHSATKYLDGQGRSLGGAILGRSDIIENCYKMLRQTGASLSPVNAWLLARSLDTLAIRMDCHCANALTLAHQLSDISGTDITKVRYPFLPNHPQYQLAKKQMHQGGGILTFELNGAIARGERFLNALELITLSANLGDTRTIASHPASTTHARLSPQQRASLGITDCTVRISVGLEDVEDIHADLLHAIAQSA